MNHLSGWFYIWYTPCMPQLQPTDQFTPREFEEIRIQQEEMSANRAHAVEMKQLEIEAQKQSTRWQIIFTIPLALLMLPVRLVASLALCIAYCRKYEPSEAFWKLLR